MKNKVLSSLLAAALALSLAACASSPASSSQPEAASASVSSEADATGTATVLDFDRNDVEVPQNPTRVAIYDYSILDMLENVGFENTGIEQLVVPAKDSLPDELSFFKEQGDDTVVSGGSLFYIDWDVLDIVQPEIVILGARSFGMNAAGERLSAEDNAKFKEDTLARYPDTTFIKLATNASNSQLWDDIQNNATALAGIFPSVAPALESKLAELETELADIKTKAEATGSTALFAMMVDQTTLSVFNPNSRFDMLYEEFGFAPVDSEAVAWEDSHGFDVRAEYVLEKNPDVIFLLDRSATVGSGAGAENFINDPVIAKTTAAQNGDIYVLSGNAWYTMTGGFTATETMIADINQYLDKQAA
ncbi:MAG: ABC transporter substrate-binding protein [Oscillospiraceae bacterium]